MNILNRRIRLQVDGGQWSHWMTVSEFRRYRAEQIKAVVIEETMSYQDAIRYVKGEKVCSAT